MVKMKSYGELSKFLFRYNGPETFEKGFGSIYGKKDVGRKMIVGRAFPKFDHNIHFKTPFERVELLYWQGPEPRNPVSVNKIELILTLKEYLDDNDIPYYEHNNELVKECLLIDVEKLKALSQTKRDLAKLLQ